MKTRAENTEYMRHYRAQRAAQGWPIKRTPIHHAEPCWWCGKPVFDVCMGPHEDFALKDTRARLHMEIDLPMTFTGKREGKRNPTRTAARMREYMRDYRAKHKAAPTPPCPKCGAKRMQREGELVWCGECAFEVAA